MPAPKEKSLSASERINRLLSESPEKQNQGVEVSATKPATLAPVAVEPTSRNPSWADRDRPELSGEDRITAEYAAVGQEVPRITRLLDKSFEQSRNRDSRRFARRINELLYDSLSNPEKGLGEVKREVSSAANRVIGPDALALARSAGRLTGVYDDNQPIIEPGQKPPGEVVSSAMHDVMAAANKPTYSDAYRAAHPQTEEKYMLWKNPVKYFSGIFGGRRSEGVLPLFYRPEREGLDPVSYTTEGLAETATRFFGSEVPAAFAFLPSIGTDAFRAWTARNNAKRRSTTLGIVDFFTSTENTLDRAANYKETADELTKVAGKSFIADIYKWTALYRDNKKVAELVDQKYGSVLAPYKQAHAALAEEYQKQGNELGVWPVKPGGGLDWEGIKGLQYPAGLPHFIAGAAQSLVQDPLRFAADHPFDAVAVAHTAQSVAGKAAHVARAAEQVLRESRLKAEDRAVAEEAKAQLDAVASLGVRGQAIVGSDKDAKADRKLWQKPGDLIAGEPYQEKPSQGDLEARYSGGKRLVEKFQEATTEDRQYTEVDGEKYKQLPTAQGTPSERSDAALNFPDDIPFNPVLGLGGGVVKNISDATPGDPRPYYPAVTGKGGRLVTLLPQSLVRSMPKKVVDYIDIVLSSPGKKDAANRKYGVGLDIGGPDVLKAFESWEPPADSEPVTEPWDPSWSDEKKVDWAEKHPASYWEVFKEATKAQKEWYRRNKKVINELQDKQFHESHELTGTTAGEYKNEAERQSVDPSSPNQVALIVLTPEQEAAYRREGVIPRSASANITTSPDVAVEMAKRTGARMAISASIPKKLITRGGKITGRTFRLTRDLLPKDLHGFNENADWKSDTHFQEQRLTNEHGVPSFNKRAFLSDAERRNVADYAASTRPIRVTAEDFLGLTSRALEKVERKGLLSLASPVAIAIKFFHKEAMDNPGYRSFVESVKEAIAENIGTKLQDFRYASETSKIKRKAEKEFYQARSLFDKEIKEVFGSLTPEEVNQFFEHAFATQADDSQVTPGVKRALDWARSYGADALEEAVDTGLLNPATAWMRRYQALRIARFGVEREQELQARRKKEAGVGRKITEEDQQALTLYQNMNNAFRKNLHQLLSIQEDPAFIEENKIESNGFWWRDQMHRATEAELANHGMLLPGQKLPKTMFHAAAVLNDFVVRTYAAREGVSVSDIYAKYYGATAGWGGEGGPASAEALFQRRRDLTAARGIEIADEAAQNLPRYYSRLVRSVERMLQGSSTEAEVNKEKVKEAFKKKAQLGEFSQLEYDNTAIDEFLDSADLYEKNASEAEVLLNEYLDYAGSRGVDRQAALVWALHPNMVDWNVAPTVGPVIADRLAMASSGRNARGWTFEDRGNPPVQANYPNMRELISKLAVIRSLGEVFGDYWQHPEPGVSGFQVEPSLVNNQAQFPEAPKITAKNLHKWTSDNHPKLADSFISSSGMKYDELVSAWSQSVKNAREIRTLTNPSHESNATPGAQQAKEAGIKAADEVMEIFKSEVLPQIKRINSYQDIEDILARVKANAASPAGNEWQVDRLLSSGMGSVIKVIAESGINACRIEAQKINDAFNSGESTTRIDDFAEFVRANFDRVLPASTWKPYLESSAEQACAYAATRIAFNFSEEGEFGVPDGGYADLDNIVDIDNRWWNVDYVGSEIRILAALTEGGEEAFAKRTSKYKDISVFKEETQNSDPARQISETNKKFEYGVGGNEVPGAPYPDLPAGDSNESWYNLSGGAAYSTRGSTYRRHLSNASDAKLVSAYDRYTRRHGEGPTEFVPGEGEVFVSPSNDPGAGAGTISQKTLDKLLLRLYASGREEVGSGGHWGYYGTDIMTHARFTIMHSREGTPAQVIQELQSDLFQQQSSTRIVSEKDIVDAVHEYDSAKAAVDAAFENLSNAIGGNALMRVLETNNGGPLEERELNIHKYSSRHAIINAVRYAVNGMANEQFGSHALYGDDVLREFRKTEKGTRIAEAFEKYLAARAVYRENVDLLTSAANSRTAFPWLQDRAYEEHMIYKSIMNAASMGMNAITYVPGAMQGYRNHHYAANIKQIRIRRPTQNEIIDGRARPGTWVISGAKTARGTAAKFEPGGEPSFNVDIHKLAKMVDPTIESRGVPFSMEEEAVAAQAEVDRVAKLWGDSKGLTPTKRLEKFQAKLAKKHGENWRDVVKPETKAVEKRAEAHPLDVIAKMEAGLSRLPEAERNRRIEAQKASMARKAGVSWEELAASPRQERGMTLAEEELIAPTIKDDSIKLFWLEKQAYAFEELEQAHSLNLQAKYNLAKLILDSAEEQERVQRETWAPGEGFVAGGAYAGLPDFTVDLPKKIGFGAFGNKDYYDKQISNKLLKLLKRVMIENGAPKEAVEKLRYRMVDYHTSPYEAMYRKGSRLARKLHETKIDVDYNRTKEEIIAMKQANDELAFKSGSYKPADFGEELQAVINLFNEPENAGATTIQDLVNNIPEDLKHQLKQGNTLRSGTGNWSALAQFVRQTQVYGPVDGGGPHSVTSTFAAMPTIEWAPELSSFLTDIPLMQGGRTGGIKGAVEFLRDGRAVMRMMTATDATTLVHESAHIWRRFMPKDLLKKAEEAFGVKDGIWDRDSEEAFAEAWEAYMADGKAPDKSLASVFRKFSENMTSVYVEAAGQLGPGAISPQMRRLFAEMLGFDPSAESIEVPPTEGLDLPRPSAFGTKGHRFVTSRTRLGMTIEEAANRSGVSVSKISALEAGQPESLTKSEMASLSNAYGLEPDAIENEVANPQEYSSRGEPNVYGVYPDEIVSQTKAAPSPAESPEMGEADIKFYETLMRVPQDKWGPADWDFVLTDWDSRHGTAGPDVPPEDILFQSDSPEKRFASQYKEAKSAARELAMSTAALADELQAKGKDAPFYLPMIKKVRPSDFLSPWSYLRRPRSGQFKQSFGELYASNSFVKDLPQIYRKWNNSRLKHQAFIKVMIGIAESTKIPHRVWDGKEEIDTTREALLPVDAITRAVASQALFEKGLVSAIDRIGMVDEAVAEALRPMVAQQQLESLVKTVKEGRVLVVPKAVKDTLRAEYSGAPKWVRLMLDEPTKRWVSWTLFARPAWVVNNIIGNSIVSILSGASPQSFLRALQEKYIARTPEDFRVSGLTESILNQQPHLGSAADTQLGQFYQWLDSNPASKAVGLVKGTLQQFNGTVEDFYRRAVYLSEAEKFTRKQYVKRNGDYFYKAYDMLREIDTMSPGQVEEVVKRVNFWLGDFQNLTPFERHFVRRIIPFYSFLRYQALLIWGLPHKYPMRSLMLRGLLNNAQQASQDEEAMLPEYLRNKGLVYTGYTTKINGRKLHVFLSTQGFNPLVMGSVSQLSDVKDVGDVLQLAQSNLGPVAGYPIAAATRQTSFGTPFTEPGTVQVNGKYFRKVEDLRGYGGRILKVYPSQRIAEVQPPIPTPIEYYVGSFPQTQLAVRMINPRAGYTAEPLSIESARAGDSATERTRLTELLRYFTGGSFVLVDETKTHVYPLSRSTMRSIVRKMAEQQSIRRGDR